jgi:hypothetical protein
VVELADVDAVERRADCRADLVDPHIALHFWGVQNVESATYAAGICTITMVKAHYKAPDDTAVFAGFDQAQANGSFLLAAGSTGRVFKFAIADAGVATLTGKGYYTVNALIQQTAGINFDGPRKARINNLLIRGPVGHGIFVEGGADTNLLGVTIDDAGIFSVYGADITSLTWSGGSGGQIIVTLDPTGPPRKRSAVRQRTPSANAGSSGARCSSSSVTAPG